MRKTAIVCAAMAAFVLPSCSDGHNPTVVAPQLSLKGTEEYEVRGKSFTRYRLTIENHAAFANEMFRAAPNLPPCGKNKNSARTWVDIMSADGKRLYGFCAFSSAESLTQLWFAVSAGSTAPKGVYVILNDREKGVKHKSNTIAIKAPQNGAGEKTTSVDDGGVESIYKALKISNVQIVGGPFSVGDTVTVAYKLTNTSDDDLRIPVDKSFSQPFNLVGTRQHWVERQGDESTIPGIPLRTGRQGSRYAAGGSIIPTKATIAASESLSFQQRVSTKDYPAGKYTYYIEYKKVRGGILQTEKIDFELTQPTKESQDAAVAAIKELGGKVTFDEKNPGKPVVAVLLHTTEVTDAGLVHVKELTSLQTLNLNGTTVSDAGLQHLKGLTSLQYLLLNGTNVTDAGLVHLKGLTSLQDLGLNGTKVTDAGLVHLKGQTSLQSLYLSGPQITDAGLVHLKELTSLTSLGLSQTEVSDAGLVYLKELTSLTSLLLTNTQQVTDVGLEHLKGMRNLKTLHLSNTQQVTDVGLEHLKGLTSLQTLGLTANTQVTDVGLEHLKGLTKLRSLYLQKTKVTDAGVKDLQSALPKCKIVK